MFIWKHELQQLHNQIASLQSQITKLALAQEAIKAAPAVAAKPKRTLTPEQRERQREYVRAYNARKKAEKAQKVAA